jgi:hypothetical protein
MKIEINGDVYDVPQDRVTRLTQDLYGLFEQMYEEKCPDEMKTGLSIVTRGLLVKEELSARAKYGKEVARGYRPPPKSDPTLWLIQLLLPHLREALSDAILTCETESETITSFSFSIPRQGVSGGQVGTDRDKWVWEDYSTQVS